MTELHKALSCRSRVEVLAELHAAAAPMSVQDLANRVGLHASTVRTHLAILENVGLVRQLRAPAHGVGRPHELFELGPKVVGGSPDAVTASGNQLVAVALASFIAQSGDDGERTAEMIGDAWGRHWANSEPFAHPTVGEAIAALERIFTALGFAPRTTQLGQVVELRLCGCPLRDLAREQPAVTIGFHRGMVAGMVAELGAPFDIESSRCTPEGDCVTIMRVSEGAARPP